MEKYFLVKVNLEKFPMSSEKFSEIGWKSETEGNASLLQGGLTPLTLMAFISK